MERYLVYVEPDPERLRVDPNKDPGPPNVLESAGDGLSRIPGYQSIGGDLDAIAEHNDRARHFREVLRLRREQVIPLQPPYPATPRTLREIEEPDRRVYLGARVEQVRSRVIDAIFKKQGEREKFKPEDQKSAK